MAKNLELNEEVLIQNLKLKSNLKFHYIKRGFLLQKLKKILRPSAEGVYSQQEHQRFYPQGEVAAHLVGFSNMDDVGQEGLELTYDNWLKGVPDEGKSCRIVEAT